MSDELKLYKIRTDGTERTKISDDNPKHIHVLHEWIYYCNWSDFGHLYKIRADGTDKQELNPSGGSSSLVSRNS